MYLYRYGSTDPFYFKATLNRQGVTALTFQANDVQFSKDGGAGANCSANGTIAETTFGFGWYQWTPSAASVTQGAEVILINIKDDVGAEFDENGFQYYLGGDAANARLDGQ